MNTIIENLPALLLASLALAEIITRLTPTKADDSLVERIGKIIKRTLDLLRVPNNRK